jgi:hypothetical protein
MRQDLEASHCICAICELVALSRNLPRSFLVRKSGNMHLGRLRAAYACMAMLDRV